MHQPPSEQGWWQCHAMEIQHKYSTIYVIDSNMKNVFLQKEYTECEILIKVYGCNMKKFKRKKSSRRHQFKLELQLYFSYFWLK